MKSIRGWTARLLGTLPTRRRKREHELAAEFESHLQMHIDDNLRAGMNVQQARREAILKLGGVEATKEAYREQSTLPYVENLLRDARFALRQLRKNPGFACTAMVMLALGICASTAIFAFVDAALIKPLPYDKPERLVGVYERVALFPQSSLSYPDYLDWKKLNTTLRSLDVYESGGMILSTPEGALPVRRARVSDGFFRTLGISPVIGRDFAAGEDLASAPRTVILSYAIWQGRYGGRADVLGKAVILDGEPNTIIGVLPRDFRFAPVGESDYWVTLHPRGNCDPNRSCHSLYGVGRLKDGVSIATALAEMKAIAKHLEEQYPGSNRDQGANVLPLSEVIVGDIRPILLVLLCGAALLLIIAGVNVASLLLVRSEGRRREISIRNALGASGRRLISQFVTEGLILVGAGSVMGVLLALWVMRLLTHLVPARMLAFMPYFEDLGLNLHVLVFAAGITAFAAVLFSLTPAIRLPLGEVKSGMEEGSRGSSGHTWRRLGSRLVVAELATAMVLLVGAGLLGKSLYLLMHVENGFQPDHLATFYLAVPRAGYEKEEQVIALHRNVTAAIAAIPGVRGVGTTSDLPLSGNGNTDWIRFLGRPYHGEHNEVNERDVSNEYFRTIQAKLLRGRFFDDNQDGLKRKVVIINEALAEKYFPGQDPLGQQIGDDGLSPKSMKVIVGIVDNIREGSLDSEVWPAVYYPFNQEPDRGFSVVVRCAQAEDSFFQTIAAVIRKIDPGIVVTREMTMRQQIADSPAAYLHRSSAWLVGGFAGLALLLSVTGLYGVVAYSVSQRNREIGVRMALGADRRNVYRLILHEAGWLTGLGVTLGLLSSMAVSSLIRSLLFSVRFWDAPTLGAVTLVLFLAALLASFLPARRAASLNPIEALRLE